MSAQGKVNGSAVKGSALAVAGRPPSTATETNGVQVYELTLADDGSPSPGAGYIRLPAPHQPYALRFSIEAGSLASKDGSLWTNFPPDGAAFDRKKFWEHKLPSDFSKAISVTLWITRAGAFEFFVSHAPAVPATPYPTKNAPHQAPPAENAARVESSRGYFNVDPVLKLPSRSPILSADRYPLDVGKGGQLGPVSPISQDGLVVQSFIAKWAGSLSTWAPHLAYARDSGYNVIHYPPLQVRGSSNSPYSIADQNDFSADLFDGNSGPAKTLDERRKTVQKYLSQIKTTYGLGSMIDVVLNHTANNSEWLNAHPEAAYSPANSPHLTPAEELDRALLDFSARLTELGLPTDPADASDVDAIIEGVRQHVLTPLKLWQYYVVDVQAELRALEEAWDKDASSSTSSRIVRSYGNDSLDGKGLSESTELLRSHALRNRMALAERYTTHFDAATALAILKTLASNDGASKQQALDALKSAADAVNVDFYSAYDDDTKAIISNLKGRLTYQRIEDGGPKLGPITKTAPFCEPYFTRLDPKHPKIASKDPKVLALAHNGWIWAADPLSDFASSSSRVYLRREVIAWGDCVKLRYGAKPADSPFLWKHMEAYCSSLAGIFDGFRIDNCHSTPIHVGEHFLDVARRVNPNLYVCAELFTGSAETDTYFVSRLGLNSLIREMDNAHDPKEESRLLYRFGVNKPIGSMDTDCLAFADTVTLPGSKGKAQSATVTPLRGSSPHALFMDLTHDNETPSHKRTAEDAITMGALVAFSWSAIGSTRGFDDLYPNLLDVVTEKRKYNVVEKIDDKSGIAAVKRVFNHLHTEMVHENYQEGHSHQENDYIMMHRVHPQTHRGYLVVTHTAFNKGGDRSRVNPFKLNRTKLRYIFGKSLQVTSTTPVKDDKVLRGLPSTLVDVPAPALQEGSDVDGSYTEVIIPDNFPPGSVMLFETWMEGLDAKLDNLVSSGASEAMAELDLVSLNVVLYRADGEERDVTGGNDGTYAVPGHGSLVYCGLEGWLAPLRDIVKNNDLGHPLCAHLRDGPWALDYLHDRLERQMSIFPQLRKPTAWFKERVDAIKAASPSFMRPKYLALLVTRAYQAARAHALKQMVPFVRDGHDFTKALALCAVQMNGQVKSASLWHDRPSASMAAGLPFFAAGWARCWGRDVFISLRGLYLVTGMYQAAREHILSFGSTLYNGMIPNLLNSTTNPRYNCRDGAWFFAQNVQDYVKMVPKGEAILQERVKRRFPPGDKWVELDSPEAFKHENTVAELLQEILQRHATGIHFREHDAGPKVDEHMRDEGFNIDIEVDWQTGIIFGGNQWNCGTWQDKNGSSTKAGNRGYPGTPRDGAAVEITGLLKSTLSWIASLSKEGKWPAKGVEAIIGGKKSVVTYADWAALVQKSFEKCYWIPLDAQEDGAFRVDHNLVNRRGIYKDVFGSGKGREWSDYQLRGNVPIAMCVAPELFTPEKALTHLQAADNVLRDVLGMRTLDPSDRNFRPDYDNSNDSDDFYVAQGHNYHEGPPWVWPVGFFLRAYVIFDLAAGVGHTRPKETHHRVMAMTTAHREFIKQSPWAGLPELTNQNGRDCPDSCKTQAWSASCLLDALEELDRRQK
ncbi:putative 4-alpha-glucanotransferase [Ceraceosorus guamensis]|uniref:Glycogen debranching enzyme n=1 Tax=Ceraceosorus guamensis TaxID=1522189 RepID=A0A316W0V5_9BASI|nr:putative 4-alpha-glucanotransferase [Ceraceosorus guamensis]PWN43329.1 putative 4-alpha-glucanotransferase [Ceraceosorus guamensis]